MDFPRGRARQSWTRSSAATTSRVTTHVACHTWALGRFGWVEGKNVRIDYRFAAGDPTLFDTYAAELVGLSPDILLAGNTPAAVALRQQTRTIPIVFVLVADPIGLGFVRSFAHPAAT